MIGRIDVTWKQIFRTNGIFRFRSFTSVLCSSCLAFLFRDKTRGTDWNIAIHLGTIDRIQGISRSAMRKKLDAYPDLTAAQKERVVEQLVLKRRLLRPVLKEFVEAQKLHAPSPNQWVQPVVDASR